MAYKRVSPTPVVEGGTGATSYTAGSVVFSNGSILTQDNSNLFWDDTNNRLGVGTTTPLHTVEIQGHLGVTRTATEADQHAVEIIADAAGFGDFKGLDIDYITGALAAGDDEEVMLVNIDESASTGGEISGYQILTTSEGSATIHGYTTGININPILHNSGTFGNATNILNKAVDVTAALANGGGGSISCFVADDDTMTIGDGSKWNEMEIILGTPASGGGIAPVFAFSTGGAGFTNFAPSDGTNGMRNSGAILWIAADLSGWATNASGRFEIRITRTRNTVTTTPIMDELQISSATEFTWDAAGDLTVNSISLSTVLAVASGGTGLATITDHGVLLGSGTSPITPLGVAANGQLIVGSTGADPVIASLTSTGSSLTVTEGAGTLNIDVAAPLIVANGGTGLTTITDNGVMVGSGTSAVTPLAVGTDGQLLIGSSAADPVFATATSSDSLLTLTLGAGTLDIVAQDAVSAAIALTDNLVTRGDGGVTGVQTSTMSITDAGEMTNASQPAFLAFLGTQDANVTGDGTTYFLGDTDIGNTLTEIYDQNADFDPGASGGAVFTAPVTGVYTFSFYFAAAGITSAENLVVSDFTTSNDTFRIVEENAFAMAINATLALGGTTNTEMDAADVATCPIRVLNGTKIVDLQPQAGAILRTWWGGKLSC